MIAAAECNLFTARLLWKVQQQLWPFPGTP